MNEELIHNSTAPVPERTVKTGETVAGVQICPIGEFPNGGKNQICSEAALNRVVENWRNAGAQDVLVDFEHKAEAGGTSDTSAAAWVTNLRVEKDRGLVGDFKMTDLGAEAVSNRRLRFLSVAWYVNKETREPVRICSVALTNKPNIPTEPILNKDQPDNPNVEDNKEPKKMDPTKIKEALGLAPDASDEDVLNAVKAAVAKNKEAEAARKQAEQAALEKEAETYAEKNKAKLDPAVIKAQYIANKEACIALVDAIPAKSTEAQVILNKGTDPKKAITKAELIKEMNKLHGQEKINFATAHAKELSAAE